MAVDYDARLHQVYAEGRKLDPALLRRWIAVFAAHAPAGRPLTVLDLGSGIGRFTPALAAELGGPVYGVEPSRRMRAVAEADATHPAVRYVDGAAEAIPLPDGCCDLALLFLTFHHFADQPRALAELVRVLRPGGAVLLRTQFADRMPDLPWYRYFPTARRIDAGMYQSLEDVRRMARGAGLVAPPEPVLVEAGDPRTLRQLYDRLSWRALSTFEHLPADEVEAGFAAFARDAEMHADRPVPPTPATMLVLRRP